MAAGDTSARFAGRTLTAVPVQQRTPTVTTKTMDVTVVGAPRTPNKSEVQDAQGGTVMSAQTGMSFQLAMGMVRTIIHCLEAGTK